MLNYTHLYMPVKGKPDLLSEQRKVKLMKLCERLNGMGISGSGRLHGGMIYEKEKDQ